jgi:hypothetical protein
MPELEQVILIDHTCKIVIRKQELTFVPFGYDNEAVVKYKGEYFIKDTKDSNKYQKLAYNPIKGIVK